MAENVDQHSLINALRDLAIEMGRTPSRDEFIQTVRGGKQAVDRAFGSYSAFIQAAGLDAPLKKKKLLSDKIFDRDIVRHLEAYRDLERPQLVSTSQWVHAAIISDIHWPFHAQKVIDKFYRYVGDEKPMWVIVAGDAWDMYSQAKFPRSHNQFTPKDEENLARKLNQEFWEEIQRLSPKSKCVQLLGNHDVRPLKRTIETMPTMEHWIQEVFKRLFSFPGVATEFDPRQELMLPGDIMVHHGYRSKLGDHRDYALYNAIVGHTHRPGVVWRKIRGTQMFEMNCGLAGDPLAKGLTYTPQKIVDWVNAFGVVDEDGPRNIIA
jgi:UDP-2,3-diacylglucosamine pyrophosphatase LpxH